MATRYYGRFTDIDGNDWKLHVYTGATSVIAESPITIRWERDASGDIYQPIQATSLQIELLGTETDGLSDIWNEEDRFWKVYLLKNDLEVYFGYISNENIEQPLDTDRYQLLIDVLDPLAYLENLAYVDASGLTYSGTASLIVIIARCLKRGFVDSADAFSIHAAPQITLTDDSRFLENAYLDQDVFLDNDEPKSCFEVLEGILLSIGCVIFQDGAIWRIVNVRNLVRHLSLDDIVFTTYDENGAFVGTTTVNIPTIQQNSIGSQASGRDIYHVNRNQRVINRKYLQSIRIKYLYNFKEQIIPNGELIAAGAGPFTMPKWTLTPGEAEAYVNGILINGVELVTEDVISAVSTPINVKSGQLIKITLEHEYVDDPTQLSIEFKLVGSSTYYLRKIVGASTSYWSITTAELTLAPLTDGIEQGQFTHVLELPEMPIDGDLTISYYNPVFGAAHTINSKVNITGVTGEVLNSNEEGLEYTAERTDKLNGRIEDVLQVEHATSDSNILLNTFLDSSDNAIENIKDSDGATVTSLQHITKDRMAIESVLSVEYTGDLKGDIERMGAKLLSDPNGAVLQTRVSKDVLTNVNSVELIGVSQSPAPTLTVTSKVVYKESVKPKIKG